MSTSEPVTVIGLDPGFGGIKAARLPDLKAVAFPSLVGVGNTQMGLLTEMVPGRRRSTTPDEVEFNGQRYLVGEHVLEYARPTERMDFQRLTDGAELRAATYTALSRLLGPGNHSNIAVTVGLPVEIMGDAQKARDTRKALRGWMKGDHEIVFNGQSISFHVIHVDVLAQPAGAYFAWGMDNTGNWIRGVETLKSSEVAICDLGFNTLDLLVVKGGQPVPRYTGGDTAGMRRAAEVIVNHLQKTADLTFTLHEADALLRSKTTQLAVASGRVELGPVLDQARDVVAGAVLGFCERRWGNARQFASVLFTGGGAEALRATLTGHYPHGIVLPDAVTANAVGLARYGAYRPAQGTFSF
jgi:hypothetical protein